MLLTCALLLVLSRPNAEPQVGQNQRPLSSPTALDREITVNLPRASLSDVVDALHSAAGIDIIADVYADDIPESAVQIRKLPVRAGLIQVGALFDREIFVQNGIVILRHRRWYVRPMQEIMQLRFCKFAR